MILGSSKKEIESLKDKTENAFEGGEYHPFEIEDDGLIGELGKNFNNLGKKLNDALTQIHKLGSVEEENKTLAEKLIEYQSSIDQLSIIGELGQKITSTLSTPEMFQKLSEIINSIMDAPVILLGITDRKKKLKFYRSPDFPQSDSDIPVVNETTVAEW